MDGNEATLAYTPRAKTQVVYQAQAVTPQARRDLNGHGSGVVWLTGLSGAGKSTLANALELRLHSLGIRTALLDGDNLRHGLNKDLGFTPTDRAENVRRVAEVARLIADTGAVVITALISPFRAERRMARHLMAPGEFVEVYVSTPLAVAEQRDCKGLYKKARLGKIHHFTGIDSPYETPEHAEIVVDTLAQSPEQAVGEIIGRLDRDGWFTRHAEVGGGG